MKHIARLILISACIATAAADTTNPVADYKSQKSLLSSDTLLKWTADLTGSGHPSVFLSLKDQYDEDVKDGQIPSWRVYIATTNGTSYSESTGVDEGNGATPVLPQLDPNQAFVGQITQLNKPGIITIQTDNPKTLPASSAIYAYTVENGHLKKTTLATFTPGQSNSIYNQYLSDACRTQIQLQQISP